MRKVKSPKGFESLFFLPYCYSIIYRKKKSIHRYWIYLEKKGLNSGNRTETGVGFVGELIELVERNAKNVGSFCWQFVDRMFRSFLII